MKTKPTAATKSKPAKPGLMLTKKPDEDWAAFKQRVIGSFQKANLVKPSDSPDTATPSHDKPRMKIELQSHDGNGNWTPQCQLVTDDTDRVVLVSGDASLAEVLLREFYNPDVDRKDSPGEGDLFLNTLLTYQGNFYSRWVEVV